MPPVFRVGSAAHIVSVNVVPQNTDVIESAESASYRPRLPRETRRLLLTALVAVLTLWVLARVRFPERPAAPNPVPPILDQLTGPPTFGELAARVGELRSRLSDSLVTLVLNRDDTHANYGGGPAEAGPYVRSHVRSYVRPYGRCTARACDRRCGAPSGAQVLAAIIERFDD